MPPRRPKPTAAELEILRVLWRRGPSTVHEVQPEIARGSRVGYTTVLKLLQIMFEKGLVTRTQQGRAFAYRPSQSRSELAAQRMRDILADAGDRAGALTGFVGGLTKRDAELLRRIVGENR